MSTEENKAVVRRWFEAFNKGKEAAMAAVDELFAPTYVGHGTGVVPDVDRAGAKQMAQAYFTAFPDLHLAVEDLIAEGDKVVVRATISGTHQGDFMGMPPTGTQVSFTATAIDRFEAGKFVESWGDVDMLGFLQQLGAIPQMAQTGA